MATLTELAVQGIVTVFGGTAAAAGLNAYFSRRATSATVAKTQVETGKTTAEITNVGAGTAQVQVDTAMDMLREVRVDMAALRLELTAARVQIASLLEWKSRHEELMVAHIRWDERVFQHLQGTGDVGPPPPLRPE